MSGIVNEECAPVGTPEDDTSSIDSEEYELLARDETIVSMMLEAEGQLCEYNASQDEWWKEGVACAQALRGAARSPLPSEVQVEETITSDMLEDGSDDETSGLVNYAPLSRENSLVKCDDDEEWVLSSILKRKSLKGVLYYQCLWKGYPEPTWETHELLENEGWSGFCDDFERKKNVANTDGHPKGEKQLFYIITYSIKRRITSFSPEAIWPNCYRTILLEAAKFGVRVTGIQNVVNDDLTRRFFKSVEGDPSSAVVMCYHGTKTRNVPGIIEQGLVIPGTRDGVRVENGSSMGVGIYTSRSLATPLSYVTPGDSYVFVVAINVSSVFLSTTKYSGDWIVVFDMAQVLPVFLLEIDYSSKPSVMEYCDVLNRPRPKNPQAVDIKKAAVANSTKGDESRVGHLRSINRKGLSKRDLKKQGRWLKGLYTKGEVKHKNSK